MLSYWQREAAGMALQGSSPPSRADVVIIGGGLAGVSAALAIIERQPGASVAVLEQKFVGYGASGRNGGLLSPLPVPVWLLTADANADHAWALQTVNRKLHELGAWLAATVPDSEVRPVTLQLQSTGRLTASGLGVIAHTLDRCRIDHQMIAQSRGGGPVLELPAFTVHPYRLVRALAARAGAKGALICEQAAVAAIQPASRGARIQLADGTVIEAGKVLVCTNAYTSSIAGPSPPRAKVVRNYMVETEPLDDEAIAQLGGGKTFIVELNKSYIFYRVHQHRLIYGGVETFFGAAKSDYEVPAGVLRKLEKHLARSMRWRHEPLPIATAWGGNFHSTATDLPIIREAAPGDAISFNIGYGGTGVALTQLFAPQAAAAALQQSCADDDDTRLAGIVARTRLPLAGLLRLGWRVVRDIVTGKTARGA
jgi:gamma-glutamylputrescine oxidase